MPAFGSTKPRPLSAALTQYTCSACKQLIPATAPRVHCRTCSDFDACATCALADPFVGTHTEMHPVTVYRISGDGTMPAVVSRASIAYNSTSTGGSESPHPQRQSAPPPPTFPSPGPSADGSTSASIPSAGVPHPPAHQGNYGPPSQSGPSGWSPLFYADMSPTPTYISVINAIFGYLDTARAGYLPPEGYSRLLDDMGYAPHENIWKSNLRSGFLQSKEAYADAAFKGALDKFGIEHILQPRGSPSGGLFGSSGGGGSMPLITARGLGDLLALELLANPADAHPKLARVVQVYSIHMHWGPLPRSVLPPAPDSRMLARIQGVQAQSVTLAAMSAQTSAQANLAAVNAIGGTQYVYRSY